MSLEKNLLIEAGAGTGKTTRLVKAVLQALFIRNIPLEAIVALTFTNKAAGELKDRVGAALEDVLSARLIDTLRQKPWWPSPEPTLPLSDLQTLATAAVGVLDRANIATIHSFAFSLLKRFPLAVGIDPNATIDDKGLRFDELFRREWPLWLSEELGDNAPREAEWLELLSKLTLSEIAEAAKALSDFRVPIDQVRLTDERLPVRLSAFHAQIQDLINRYPGDLNANKVAKACEEIAGAGSHLAWEAIETLSDETRADLALEVGKPKAWSAEDLQVLKILQKICENVLAGGDRITALLTELLERFVRPFRQTLLSEGCLTHSALLYLSREIVKNDLAIRNALKQTIRLILIDEFQDTDPLQAELLLYLAEKSNSHATAWDKVALEPGKLFIVGDPKQSIYRFRGADIAAYERIGKLLVEQGGFQETLAVNYRSQAQIIQVVNQAFERIISHRPEISPPYAAVEPHHPRDAAHPVQNVEIWLAESPEPQSVEDAQATEAEYAAHWIQNAVGNFTVFDAREGRRRPMIYRDVAFIFRTYSPMDRFIEALRRRGIPFAVESERYFFTTPEVTDFINLLRAAEDPDDVLSLVGYLRGALGGLTDDEILRRKNAGTLEEVESVRWLRTITARLGREPLSDVLQAIFESSFLMEMAARSYHGDQTVANLLKLRRLLEGFAAEGLTTMGLLLKKLEEFFGDDKIEGESPLADENYNAVRLLTIHKSKGLEYPVVFLPSLHSELRSHPPEPFVYDWRTRKLGLTVGRFSNLDKLEIDQQTKVRETAEEDRILYVAMTRARERLVLSGGVNLKSNRSRNYLNQLLGAWGLSLDSLVDGDVQIGETTLCVQRLPRLKPQEEKTTEVIENPLKRVNPGEFASVWKDRATNAAQARQTPRIQTPTGQTRQQTLIDRESKEEFPKSTPEVGTLLHLFLEHWDFACKKGEMPMALHRLAKNNFSDETMDQAERVLAGFIGSDAFNEIATSQILAREMPFFYKESESLMRGTMDIVYRTADGALVIGDYKSGGNHEEYQQQGKAYQEALRRALGEDAVFKIIPLRGQFTE